jgi:hypothetical protein
MDGRRGADAPTRARLELSGAGRWHSIISSPSISRLRCGSYPRVGEDEPMPALEAGRADGARLREAGELAACGWGRALAEAGAAAAKPAFRLGEVCTCAEFAAAAAAAPSEGDGAGAGSECDRAMRSDAEGMAEPEEDAGEGAARKISSMSASASSSPCSSSSDSPSRPSRRVRS